MRRSHGRNDGPKTPQRLIRLHERLLRSILGVAARDHVCHPDREVAVPSDELGVRVDIAAPRPFDEFAVVQW